MKLIKDKIHEVIVALVNIAREFFGSTERKSKKRYEFEYDPSANTEGIWFTQEEFDDHTERFGGFVRKGKTRLKDYEALLDNVNVYNHKDAIHALCRSEANKNLWRILMDALEQVRGTEVIVKSIRDYISLGGLITLVNNDTINTEARRNIDIYLRSLPDYQVGLDAREQPDKAYETHCVVAMDVWSAVMEQIEN